MIQNMWKKVHLFCGNHEKCDMVEMQLHNPTDSDKSIFYSCPKYYNENRKEWETACVNRLDLNEVEKMVDHFSKIIEEEEDAGGQINIKGLKWKSKKGVEYEVLKHTDKEVNIAALNRRALK